MKSKFLILSLFLISSIITIAQKSDTIPPVLNSVQITPNVIESGETIEIIANITDEESGVKNIQLIIKSPNGEQEYKIWSDIGVDQRWVSIGNNNYKAIQKISEWAVGGEWRVSMVIFHDNDENWDWAFSYSHELPTFTVNASTPDYLPPVLNTFSLSPNVVNKGDSIHLLINATDDVSGIGSILFQLTDPNSLKIFTGGVVGDQIKDLGDDNYENYFVLYLDGFPIANGEWQVINISLEDIAGNLLYLNNDDSALATFTVIESTSIIDESLNLDIYPNPSNGLINISNTEEKNIITIYSILGEKILTNYNTSIIDLSNQKKGMYIINIETSKGKTVKKVLIE